MATSDPGNSSSAEGKTEGCDGKDETTVDTIQWSRLFDWIHCICVVTFDLELGQAMEVNMKILSFFVDQLYVKFFQEIYPPDTILTEEDKTNICYLAFPDSNSSCMGDTQFHIRIKQCSRASKLTQCHLSYNNTCPVFLRINPHYYFGFVHFRQIKDQTLPRGYFQKVSAPIQKLFIRLPI